MPAYWSRTAVYQELTLGGAAGLLPRGTFSLMGWFRSPSSLTHRHIYTEDAAFNIQAYVRIDNAHHFDLWFRTPTNFAQITSTAAYDDDDWHWFLWVKRATNDYQLWIDGTSIGTSAVTTGTDATASIKAIGNWQQAAVDTQDQPFAGHLARMIALPDAITAEEARAILRTGVTGRPKLWHFELDGRLPESTVPGPGATGLAYVAASTVAPGVSQVALPAGVQPLWVPPPAPALDVPLAAQLARPASDVSNAGVWVPQPASPTTLFDKLDDEQPDAAAQTDYVSSPSGPVNAMAEVALAALTDPVLSRDYAVEVVAARVTGTRPVDLLIDLYEGATKRAGWQDALTDVPTGYLHALLTSELDAISNHANLRLRLTADQGPLIIPPPSYVGAGTASFTATNATALTPGLPTGWAADDVHVLFAARSDNTAGTTPTGWTNIASLTGNNTTAQRVEVYARRAVAGDTAPTFTFGTSTVVRGARIYGIRGCPTSSTVDTVIDVSSRLANAAAATVSFTSVTTTQANDFVLLLGAYEDDPTTVTTATNFTQPSGAVSGSALGNDMMLFHQYVLQGAAGSVAAGPLTVSGGTFTNSVSTGILIAVKGVTPAAPQARVYWAGMVAPAATGPATQTIAAAGAASGEAGGISAAVAGTVTLSPAGVRTEAVGVSAVASITVLGPAAAATSEQAGAAAATILATISPAGVRTEATGAAAVTSTATVAPAGALSAESAGTPSAASVTLVTPAGAGSTERGGVAAVSASATIAAAGTRSDERAGAPSLMASVTVQPAAAPSGESAGASALAGVTLITPAGARSDERATVSTASASAAISPAGTPSSERAGASVAAPGAVTVAPAGAGSGEAAGVPAFAVGGGAPQTIAPAGVASPATAGVVQVAPGAATLAAAAASSSERAGVSAAVPGAVTVGPSGAPSAASAGVSLLANTVVLAPAAVVSEERVGRSQISTLAIIVSVPGAAGELAGPAAVLPGPIVLVPAGAASGEIAGSVLVAALSALSGPEAELTMTRRPRATVLMIGTHR